MIYLVDVAVVLTFVVTEIILATNQMDAGLRAQANALVFIGLAILATQTRKGK